MSFVPEDKSHIKINLAPMIDFLFLMLVFFATLAVSRVTTRDTEIEMVKVRPEQVNPSNHSMAQKLVSISINDKGEYKWVTDVRDYPMRNPKAIANELLLQHKKGLIPQEKAQTQVLLRIDAKAQWEPIMKAIFSIREAGFDVYPVYEPGVS